MRPESPHVVALRSRAGVALILTTVLASAGASIDANVLKVAPSIGFLIAARIVQGLGGALVVSNSLALVNGMLRRSDRARGIGI